MKETDFIEVVSATELEDADAQFDAWLQDRGLRASDINPEDIRADLIRSEEGHTLKRYRVRRSAVEK